MSINPLLLELPMPIITPRLKIVSCDPEYAADLLQAKNESMPQLREWMSWAHNKEQTLEELTAQMREWYAKFILREELMLLAYTHEDELVVATGFHRVDWKIPRADIGYWCKTSAQGNGYVTEAANALTRYAFEVLKFRKVTIHVDKENTKSAAIPQRLGFLHEYDDLGCITKPNDDALRTKSVYSRFRWTVYHHLM